MLNKNIILCLLMFTAQSALSMHMAYEQYKLDHTNQEVRLYDRYKKPCCDLEVSLNLAINDLPKHLADKYVSTYAFCFAECCLSKFCKPERAHAYLVEDVKKHRSLKFRLPVTLQKHPFVQFRSPVTFGKAPEPQKMK